jgi:hypothetical protein
VELETGEKSIQAAAEMGVQEEDDIIFFGISFRVKNNCIAELFA